MVTALDGVTLVKELVVKGYSVQYLCVLICETLDKHNQGVKLTKAEQFIASLRYSEFSATDTTNYAYYQAEIKRTDWLKQLGITVDDINRLCFEIGGYQ